MKKLLLSLLFLLPFAIANGQSINVHFKNGQTIKYPYQNVDYVDFSDKEAEPQLTAGKAVDLGLSVYWASCNVGAETPGDYGNYYALGETSPKSYYGEENYSFYNKETKKYTFFGNEIAGTEYDAATVNWGKDWKMPTKAQFQELRDKCTWEWTQDEGANGYKVTARNGNSIFLPATGWNNYALLSIDEQLYYWISDSIAKAKGSYFTFSGNSNNSYIGMFNKYIGLSVRPVTTNPNATGELIDHSQDHLVTDKISLTHTGGSYVLVNGLYQSGSAFSFEFKNGSDKDVELNGIYLMSASSSSQGNNALDASVTVKAGESMSYTVRTFASMSDPKPCSPTSIIRGLIQ